MDCGDFGFFGMGEVNIEDYIGDNTNDNPSHTGIASRAAQKFDQTEALFEHAERTLISRRRSEMWCQSCSLVAF